MDSLTHALIITVLLILIGRPDLIPYGIMGAVLIDIDVAFQLISDRDPRLYIFTHGGFTHSFLGASIISLGIVVIGIALSSVFGPFGPMALLAITGGALSHLAIDFLACPGIPLLYPLTDRKYTAGILGGPSVFIMVASIAYIILMLLGQADIRHPWAYIAVFLLVGTLSAGTKAYAALTIKGRTIATKSPFRWLVIEDTPEAYLFYEYDLFNGRSSGESYEKFKGITPDDAGLYDRMPELRRLRYHSYIVTAEKNGSSITYRDPMRELRHVWYPPYFKSLTIPCRP